MFDSQEQGLLPVNPTTLNPRKRKRLADPASVQLFEPFHILDGDVQITLQPHLILARSSVPLSYLHLTCDTNLSQPCAQIFVSKASSLEFFVRREGLNGPLILVGGTDNSTQLYGVEKTALHTYTLSRFAPWVSLHTLQELGDCTTDPHFTSSDHPNKSPSLTAWWSRMAFGPGPCRESPTLYSHCSKILAAPESAPQHRVDHWRIEAVPDVLHSDAAHLRAVEPELYNNIQPIFVNQEDEVTLDGIASGIVLQYLEVLYLSKASLAYFPKGSLSRARASAGNSDTGKIDPLQLASTLRDMVLSGAVFDKKYKSKLPDLLQTMLSQTLPYVNASGVASEKPAKSKRLRKPKPGKDGTYLIEPDYVLQWWQSEDAAGLLELNETAIREKIAGLRFRESLLQIIVVLEILALETIRPGMGSPVPDALAMKTQPDQPSGRDNCSHVSGKIKKPKDMNVILDTLVDRVCIWQSVGSMESDGLHDGDSRASKSRNAETSAGARNDKLRDFCVDILVPFYAPRLPRKVDSLARRMGVSVKPSPQKPSHAPTSRHRTGNVAPGSEIRRNALRRQQNSTDIKSKTTQRDSGSLPTPSMTRASTDTFLLQEVKRERSSTPQGESLKSSRKGLSRTNSIGGAKNFNTREIDLTALNKYRASKDKKKVSVEQELREAIAALKKPNRNAAAKEYTDEAERRAPGALRNKGPTKSKLAVEIGVTPRKDGRTLNLGFMPAVSHEPPSFANDSPSKVVPSTNPVIPASVQRQPLIKGARDSSNVLETPSRGPSKKVDALQAETFGNPLDDNRDIIPHSAVKPACQPSPSMRKATATLLSLNASTENGESLMFQDVLSETSRMHSSEKSSSIYDMLGWDDDGDADELL